MERLVVCFDTYPLNDVDTATQTQHEFQAIHFSWYNRHTTKGHDAPSDVPLQMMSKLGCSRTNYHQMIPYPSKDMVVHEPIYQAMERILGDVFSWMDTKVQTILPGVYHHLDVMASILPNHQQLLVNLFVALVINVNVTSYAHRDSKDDTVCVVLAVGKLCLHEAGLVILLCHGHFVIFPSCKLMHFNLHCKGQWASIVLHMDREMLRWAESNHNGWASNTYFH
ncbi:hypothetical protein C8Q72DRAFT_769614 [Fomitopsis betulina]|nr:hypothetical protein C8Q72DRAFT_769614 [Fomitopsis betulina]